MKKDKHRLTKRERLFCVYYANSADIKQSVKNAGYKTDLDTKGMDLLCRKDITDEINRITDVRQGIIRNMVMLGFERLAFSKVCDCVGLLYMDESDSDKFKSLDLSAVSEIKKLKDGAMEIKFFDKLKALEKLSQLCKEESSEQTGFMDALCMGAKNLCDIEGAENEV